MNTGTPGQVHFANLGLYTEGHARVRDSRNPEQGTTEWNGLHGALELTECLPTHRLDDAHTAARAGRQV